MINRPFFDTKLNNISDKNKNKFYEEKFIIYSPYFDKSNKKLLVVGDLHYQKNVSKEIYRMLILYVIYNKPDYVLFPGDIFENDSILEDENEKNFLLSFFTAISEVSKVVITPGNHDIHNLSIKSWILRNSKESNKILKFLESLNKIKNIYFLNNEQVNLDGINFLGFSPSYKTYDLGIKKEAIELFMNEYINSKLKMNENEFNVLLTHNPLLFTTSDEYKHVNDFNNKTDLIISGHMHGGYIPRCLYDKLKDTNIGIFFYPLIFPIPGVSCRGLHDIGRGKLFISKGYRKWTADMPLFNFFEKSSANDVEELILTNETVERKLTR